MSFLAEKGVMIITKEFILGLQMDDLGIIFNFRCFHVLDSIILHSSRIGSLTNGE
jgi:hypothetical protein